MRKIKIVSDSSSDLLTLEQTEFAFAPMKIITAEKEFVDSAALDVESMVSFSMVFPQERSALPIARMNLLLSG